MMLRKVILASTFVLVASGMKCQEWKIGTELLTENTTFDLKAMKTQYDITAFFTRLSRRGTNYIKAITIGVSLLFFLPSIFLSFTLLYIVSYYPLIHIAFSVFFSESHKTITNTPFSQRHEVIWRPWIQTTYCEPDAGPSHTLEILTHGMASDRSYWHMPMRGYEHSYVQRAVDELGHSVIIWDRGGTTPSNPGMPIRQLQVNLHIDTIRSMIDTLMKDNNLLFSAIELRRIILVGHGLGSAITYGFIHKHPNMVDAAILTGFSRAKEFLPQLALTGGWATASDMPWLGPYRNPVEEVVPRSIIGMQHLFLAPGHFHEDTLIQMSLKRQPTSLGEFLTLFEGIEVPNVFPGPVLLMNGG